MSKSAAIRVRQGEPELKEESKSIFEKIGLAISSVASYFSSRSRARLAYRIENEIPNRQTRRAIKDVKLRRNLKEYKDADEMFRDLGLK